MTTWLINLTLLAAPAVSDFNPCALTTLGVNVDGPVEWVTPFWCQLPVRSDGSQVRYCGGMGYVMVRDAAQCVDPHMLIVPPVPTEARPASWYAERGYDRYIVDWSGPRGDTDGNGVIDVDDIQNVLWSFGSVGPAYGDPDVCPELCSDGTIDIEDVMAVLAGFQGRILECGW